MEQINFMFVYVLVVECYLFPYLYLKDVYAYSFLLLDLMHKIFSSEVLEHS